MMISAKFSLGFSYPELERCWAAADRLGFASVWDYDHFYGHTTPTDPTFEAYTALAAMAVVVKRARIACVVPSVTYRNPALLAKMAVTVDHISGGRLDFGLGAGWLELEHRGYGIPFPPAGQRVAMLDEALTIIRRLWTEDSVSFSGRFFTLEDALCYPKPIQRPYPPIIVGASKPKMMRVVARHADEWNMPGHDGPEVWGAANDALDSACAEVGRDPTTIRRSTQLSLRLHEPGQVEAQLALLPDFERAGCEHAALAFREPPIPELLERCAGLNDRRE